jgi:SAM-dependent MidA family methyltransferase
MGPPNLEARIHDEIRQRGPIPFADFMRAALYEPDGGYYTSGVDHVGAEGDFYTAPATHPAFGAMLALQLERIWELLDRPRPMAILEGGGGKGLLAADILAYAKLLNAGFSDSLDYRIVEMGRTGHVSGFSPDGIDIRWSGSTSPPAVGTGVFLSNELFDAYPRHRVIDHGGQLYEILIDERVDGFVEALGPPSTPELVEYFEGVGVPLPDGCQADVDLAGPRSFADIAEGIERGFTITIDYGSPAETLFSPARRRGTLLCYHRHVSSTNPYIRIGKQDITAHVDFTALARAGESRGMITEGLMTQQRYLKKLGIQTLIDGLRGLHDLSSQQVMANRMAMLELTGPTGFGGFGVLIQSKGVGAPFGVDDVVVSRARSGLTDISVPLLTDAHTPVFDGKYPQYAEMPDLRTLQ